mgnify:CR=1 FL=1
MRYALACQTMPVLLEVSAGTEHARYAYKLLDIVADRKGPCLPEIRDLNISIELWSMAFCAVCIVCCLMLIRVRSRQRGLIVLGLALEFVAAGCDALAGIFRGQEGQLAWAATHVGNAASFVACFFLLATLTSYLCLRIESAGGPRYRRWELAAWAFAVVMGVLTLAGAHFYIDDANVYHRGAGYWMIPAYVVAVNGVNAVLERCQVFRHKKLR